MSWKQIWKRKYKKYWKSPVSHLKFDDSINEIRRFNQAQKIDTVSMKFCYF